MAEPTRRNVIALLTGMAAAGLGGLAVGAQRRDEPEPAEDEEYWSITAETAGEAVTEDVNESVVADGDIYVTESVEIDGGIETRGHVVLEQGVTVADEITAAGGVVTGGDLAVEGDVTAGLDAFVGLDLAETRERYEDGALEEPEDLPLGSHCEVAGTVTGGGAVVIAEDSAVEGAVVASRDVRVGANTELHGDLLTAGAVVFDGNVVVRGLVIAAAGQEGEYDDGRG